MPDKATHYFILENANQRLPRTLITPIPFGKPPKGDNSASAKKPIELSHQR
jgi:hypothetical protein